MKASRMMCLVAAVLITGAYAYGAEKDEYDPKPDKPVALCKDHGVPADVCVLCHPKLAKDFKAKGDWCAEHKVPESQCFLCHPDLKARFLALSKGEAPKKLKEDVVHDPKK